MQTAYMTLVLILTVAVLGLGILDANTGSGHASSGRDFTGQLLNSSTTFCRSCR